MSIVERLSQLEEHYGLLLKNKETEEATLSRLRLQLLHLYRDRIVGNILEATDKAIDSNMWKLCFHRPIDGLRRQLKLVGEARESQQLLTDLHRLIAVGLAKLVHLVAELILQLPPSNRPVLERLLITLGMSMTGQSAPANEVSVDPVVGRAAAKLSARLLICCGDLARYQYQFLPAGPVTESSTRRSALLSLAYSFYWTSLGLDEGSGHACNQLAVTGTLLEDLPMALHWYRRAELAKDSFGPASSNLLVYLERCARSESNRWTVLANRLHSILIGTGVSSLSLEAAQTPKTEPLLPETSPQSISLLLIGLANSIRIAEAAEKRGLLQELLECILEELLEKGLLNLSAEGETPILLAISLSEVSGWINPAHGGLAHRLRTALDKFGLSKLLTEAASYTLWTGMALDAVPVNPATAASEQNISSDDEVIVFRGLRNQ